MRDRRRAWIASVAAPVTSWLIEALAVQPGATVLELAAGAGDTGFAIIDAVGRRVRLISSDVSPATLEVARRAADERGLAGIEFRVLDAQDINLPTVSVDAVVCRWGFMLMEDPTSALRETARVLRAGGRLALSVWGERDRNPWTTTDAEVCARVGYASATDPTDRGGMFSLADAGRLRATVDAGGLEVRRMEAVPVSWPYASVNDYIATEIERPDARGDFFRSLPDRRRQEAIELATKLLEPFRTDAGYLVPGETLNVLAVAGVPPNSRLG